jgi:hypothetical protein
MYKGNATDQVLTNLNLENERKGLKMYPYLLNTAHLILILVLFITPYWCFKETPLSNYKVEEGFQSICIIGNRTLQ